MKKIIKFVPKVLTFVPKLCYNYYRDVGECHEKKEHFKFDKILFGKK